jgi:hypothetical protein
MCAVLSTSDKLVDEYAAELAEAAYPVVLKHGVRGTSVDVELGVWRAIRDVLQKGRRAKGKDVSSRPSPIREDLLAEVSTAAYQVALNQGLKGPFLDLELRLWDALGKVGR